MDWKPYHTRLNKIFAGLVPFKKEAFQIASQALLNVSQISFDDRPNTNWFGIIRQAILEEKVNQLIDVFIEFQGELPILINIKNGLADSMIPEDSLLPDMQWSLQDDAIPYEKIIGRESTLLPISYLEKGLEIAKSVVKIVTPAGSGTGFLTADNTIITNHHVIPSVKVARKSHVIFNYQKSLKGLDLPIEKVLFDADSFFETNKKDDWSAIKIAGNQNKKWGQINISDQLEIAKNDRVTIIQHPGGGPKQIAFYHNYIRYYDERIVQYLTDTLPGSSGSPVFDNEWNLVALHHAGGYIREPNTKRQVFRNQGIRASRIRYNH